MAGKFNFKYGGASKQQMDDIEAQEALDIAQGIIADPKDDREIYSDVVPLTHTQNPLKQDVRGQLRDVVTGRHEAGIHPTRKAVLNKAGQVVYAPLDADSNAAAIQFAAEQVALAQKASRNIPPNVGTISDPMVRRAVSATGLPQWMDFMDDWKYGPPPGNVLEAARGTYMDPDQQADEVDRLIREGVIPVGSGGVVKKLIAETAQLNDAQGKALEKPFMMRKGSYVSATRQDVEEVMTRLWGDTRLLQTLILDLVKKDPTATKFKRGVIQTAFANFTSAKMIDQETGKRVDRRDSEKGLEGLTNERLFFSLLLAYYRTLEEARFADWSQEEKQKHFRFGMENMYEVPNPLAPGILKKRPVDPSIYTAEEGRTSAITPKRRVLYEKMGDYIEQVTRAKFKNPSDKQIISNALVQLIEDSDIPSHSGATRYVDPKDTGRVLRGEDIKTSKDLAAIEQSGVWKIVEDISIDDTLNEFLHQSKGIRDLLQPNFRNHVRVVPKTNEDQRTLYDELAGTRSSGVSPIRTMYQNIQESFPFMLNPLGLNMLRSLYTVEDDTGNWFDFLNSALKIKPEHFQILMQEDAWIQQNSPDGKTFYVDTVRRSSGRTGHSTLLMSDIKAMRALTIPRFDSWTFQTTRGAKLNEDEKTFLYSVLGMLGMADAVPEALDRKIKEIINAPDHAWRRIGRALNQAAETGVLPTSSMGMTNTLRKTFSPSGAQMDPVFVTVADLEANRGALKEGLHSLEALRALENYMSAKFNPKVNDFSTKFISELDAAQSGPTIQAAQIGNWKGLYAGGLPTDKIMWKKRKDQGSRFALPKLYQATVGIAQQDIEKRIKAGDDQDFITFVRTVFGEKDGNNNIVLDRLWDNAVGFAKSGLVGASYGQGEAGSIISISEEIKKFFEETLDENGVNKLINDLNTSDRFGPDSAYIDMYNYRIQMQGTAYEQLNKLSEIFVKAMHTADPNILKYSRKMRQVFRTYVTFADFAKKQGEWANALDASGVPYADRQALFPKFKAPQIVYKEPYALSNDDIYNKPWVNGMTTSMLDNHIPDAWKSIDVLDSTIFYQTGAVEPDLAKEVTALDFENPQGIRSQAITRFPVISIHGLDDLIQAIAVNELYNKYGPNGTIKPNEFNYFVSVWDAGLMQPNMRKRYTEEYNKAFAKVMKENNFFSQLTSAWENATAHITKDDIKDANLRRQYEELTEKLIPELRAITTEFYLGSDKRDNKGIIKAQEVMDENSIFQIYTPEIHSELLDSINKTSIASHAKELDLRQSFSVWERKENKYREKRKGGKK